MRLSQKLSRLAAAFMATAMLACTAALPASALDTGVTAGADVTVDTVFTIPANVKTPNVTFTYTVSTATPVTQPTAETDGGREVKAGVDGGVYFGTQESKVSTQDVVFDPSLNADPSKNFTEDHTVTRDMTLHVDATAFQYAGVYKYTITQALKGDNGNVTLDSAPTKTLYVYVEDNNGTISVAYTKLFAGNNVSGKTDNFTAEYLKDYEPNNDEGTLLLSKNVTGTFGDKNKEFEFTVKVQPVTTGNTYYYEVGTVSDQGVFTADQKQEADKQVIRATEATIKLKHHQAIKIYGLVAGDTYTIVETSGGQNGYTTTATVDNVAENNLVANSYGVTKTIAETEGKVKAVKVAYTNNLESTAPTGVVMNVAPYILLVVIAVAGAFVFLRKRRED